MRRVKQNYVGQEIYFSQYDMVYQIESFPTRYSVILVAMREKSGKPSRMKISLMDLPTSIVTVRTFPNPAAAGASRDNS